MTDDHLTTEEECPECRAFDRCDFHEGVRRGRQQIRDGEYVELEDCENYCDRGIPYDDYDILHNICEAVKLMREIRLEEARNTEQAMVRNALESLEHSLQRWGYPCEVEDTATDEAYVQLTTVYECPYCGKQGYFHQNISASILWCEEHGVLAVQKSYRGDVGRVKQMTDEQYAEFVEGEDTAGDGCPHCDGPEPIGDCTCDQPPWIEETSEKSCSGLNENSEESCNTVNGLEPAAWEYRCEECGNPVFTRSASTIARKCPHNHPYQNQLTDMDRQGPLFRLSDVISYLQEKNHAQAAELLKEFTQKGDTE